MAVEDLEIAVVKALSQAPLSIDEALEILETDSSALIEEFGLTVGESNNVFNWLKYEAMRHISQSQMDTVRYPLEEGPKSKIGREDLRGMILEELQLEAGPNMDIPQGREKLFEQGGWENEDTSSQLLGFAQAWSGLGGAVQEQVVAVLAAWERGAHEPDWSETVYEQNPAAIDMAVQRLGRFLRDLGEDGEFLWDALEEAQKIYRQGDDEVASDRAAAMGESDY